jgi:hypothetical protein
MLNPLTHRKVLKKGMPGMATIVEMGVMDRDATSSNMPMTLQVHVEGITPYEVEGQWMVKAKDGVGLSGAIPVKVDPEDHDKVAIDWDGVRAQYEEHKAQRQQALAGGGGMGGMGGAVQGASPTIDLRNDPELRAKIEGIVGHKLTPGSSESVAENDPAMQMQIMQVVQQHMAEKAGGGGMPAAPAVGGGGGDDPVAKLERLAALKESGALTEKEFEREKKKLLGS